MCKSRVQQVNMCRSRVQQVNMCKSRVQQVNMCKSRVQQVNMCKSRVQQVNMCKSRVQQVNMCKSRVRIFRCRAFRRRNFEEIRDAHRPSTIKSIAEAKRVVSNLVACKFDQTLLNQFISLFLCILWLACRVPQALLLRSEGNVA